MKQLNREEKRQFSIKVAEISIAYSCSINKHEHEILKYFTAIHLKLMTGKPLKDSELVQARNLITKSKGGKENEAKNTQNKSRRGLSRR